MSGAERAYRLLLRAYPADFRAAYGREMALAFRDQLRDRRRGTGGDALGFWAAAVWDVTRSAPALRLDALRARRRAGGRARRDGPWRGGPHFHLEGGTMNGERAVAVLAVLGGAFELANTGAAFWGAGHPPRGAGEVLAVSLAVLLGLLLAAAGVALLRGGAGAARVARGAAVGGLAVIVGLQLWFPFMSIFARLLGVVIPVALLLVTRRTGGTPGRDGSVTAVA